jgi:hypothetical protein
MISFEMAFAGRVPVHIMELFRQQNFNAIPGTFENSKTNVFYNWGFLRRAQEESCMFSFGAGGHSFTFLIKPDASVTDRACQVLMVGMDGQFLSDNDWRTFTLLNEDNLVRVTSGWAL